MAAVKTPIVLIYFHILGIIPQIKTNQKDIYYQFMWAVAGYKYTTIVLKGWMITFVIDSNNLNINIAFNYN